MQIAFLSLVFSLSHSHKFGIRISPQKDLAGPRTMDNLNPSGIETAGIKMIAVCGGKYKVWTKRMGKGDVKCLLLHGGPGSSHDYLECFESFLPQAGIEMYYYDQLGAGNSDRPEDESLWNLDRYLDEVEEVRQGLALTDFVLYGHSWGGILTMEYALRYQHDGHLRAIVISNMVSSIDAILASAAKWKGILPADILRKVDEIEEKEDWDNPEYEKIMMDHLYPKMVCRLQPWPEPVTRGFRLMNQQIYVQMQGHSEFVVTGNLRGWTCHDRLHNITLRTLVIGAQNDEVTPEDCKKMAEVLPNAEVVICPQGSHMVSLLHASTVPVASSSCDLRTKWLTFFWGDV